MSWVFRYDMTGMQWCLSNVWGGESERPSFRPSMAPWEIFSPFWVWGFQPRSDVQMLGYQLWWPWYPILWVYDSGSTMVARKVPQASEAAETWTNLVPYRNLRHISVVQLKLFRLPTKTEGEISARHIWIHLRCFAFCVANWVPFEPDFVGFGSLFICLPWILRRHFEWWGWVTFSISRAGHQHTQRFGISGYFSHIWTGRAAPICRFPCNSRTARSLCLPMNDILGSFMESFPRSTWPLATSWNGDFAPAVGTEFFEPGDQMHWGERSQLDSKETSTWKFWMKDNICHSWYLSINLLTYLNIHISLVILVHKFFEFRDFFAKLVRKRLPARPAPSCRGCFLSRIRLQPWHDSALAQNSEHL